MFLPLKMTLKPSRLLLLVLAVLHALAAWAVMLTALPVALQVSILVALLAGFGWQVWIYRRFKIGRQVRVIRVDTKNALWLEGLSDEPQLAELKSAWLGAGFGLATMSSKGKSYRLLWMPDSADRQDLRRWRVWLSWRGA